MKFGQARDEARRLLQAGDYPAALAAHHHLLLAAPHDLEVRLGAADVLAKVGLIDEAGEVYQTVARHSLDTGRPLLAAVAAHLAAEHGVAGGPARPDLLREIATRTAGGSPHLVKFAVRPAPTDPEQEIESAPVAAAPFDQLAEETRRLATDGTPFEGRNDAFHPLPLLSELGPAELHAVLQSAALRRLNDGQPVVRQGDPGTALFFVGRGQVRVVGVTPDGEEHEHARLHENALFGEMALLTSQPRSASVAAMADADVLEVSRGALAAIGARHPEVAILLDRYARERLIKNLLATSPLFTPFTRAQQADLLRRFEGIEFAAGADVIGEGDEGKGLFVVLSGQVQVLRATPGGDTVQLARLQPGDVFGEMALLADGPTNATVRATTPLTTLFLPRGYFERLVTAIPELRQYFQELAAMRAVATGQMLHRPQGSRPAVPVVEDDPTEIALSEQDLVLI